MADLNNPKRVNDLVETLILASSRTTKVQVVKESEIQLLIDGVPYDFQIDFDSETGYWFL